MALPSGKSSKIFEFFSYIKRSTLTFECLTYSATNIEQYFI